MKRSKLVISLVLLKFIVLFSAPAQAGFPQDFDDVVWLHSDVSSWKETGALRSISTTSSSITLNYDQKNSWPAKTITSSAGAAVRVSANPWIFVQRNGTWYAATWEWLRPGQITKSKAAVKGDHIKKAPLDNFVPRQGEVYGFMISGLARYALRNVEERTNVVLFRWDNEMVPYCTAAPVITRFNTSKAEVIGAANIQLSWEIEDADRASISPVPGKVNPDSGSINTRVEETTTYDLSASNDCGTTHARKTIEVTNIGSLLTFLSALLLEPNE